MRSPDSQGGGGNDDPFANYNGKIEGATEEAPNKDEGIKLEIEDPKKETPAENPKKETPAEDPKKETPAEKSGGAEDLPKENEVFTTEDLGIKTDDSTPDENYSFTEIATEIGFKTEEDSIDGLKKGLTSYVADQRQQAVQEYLEREKKYSPDAMNLINAFNAGLTETELFSVQEGYIDALAMTDEEKIVLQATSNNLTEAEGKARYEQLIADGTLEEAIENIDTALRNQMVKVRQEKIKEYQQRAIDNKAKADATAVKENALILEAINNRSSFMGVPLSPEVKKALTTRWNSGVYRRAFESDPNKVVDFILTTEFGEKVANKRVDAASKETKKELQGKLHNLDAAKAGSSVAGQQEKAAENVDPNDPFKHYKGLDENAEYRVNHQRN